MTKPVDLHLVRVLEAELVPLLKGPLPREGAAEGTGGWAPPDDSGDEPGALLGLESDPSVAV